MYYYYGGIHMLRKELDSIIRRISTDAKKLRDRSTRERTTHNICDCERVSTNCEAEDRNARAYRTC